MEKIYNAFEKAKNDKCNAIVTLVEPKDNLNKGKLSGEPIILKDNISTKGIRTTASSKILDNYYPIFDSTVVEKIKSEGGVIIGKASMDELAMGGTNLAAYTGPVLNPWDYKRMSGGSSGGSAAVVSSGIVSFAIGSDTGDSVRKPASFCGIVGVKPTYGRISRYGVVAYASSLDHVGYFTRNVKDASLMLEVLAGRDDKDMTSSFKEVKEYSKLLNSDVKGKKIAVFKNVIDSLDNENTLNLFNDLLNKLKEKGAIIEEVSFDNDLMRTLFPVYFIIANCEATSNHSNLDGLRFGVSEDGDDTREVVINSRTKGFGSLIRKRFVIGSFGLHEENQEKVFKKAQRIRRLIVEEVKKCLEEYDCLIAPASNDIAPLLEGNKIDELSDKYLICENHMVIGNFTGYPSMTVPMGFEKGCPIGVNITCKAFDEENMFNIGLAIEESTGLKDLVAKVD